MAQHDPGGTSYAPNASPPKDGVRVRWKQPIEMTTGVTPPPIVANGRVYGVGQKLVCVTAAEGDCVFRSEHNAGPPAVAAARAYQSPTLVFPTWDGAIGLNARGGVSLAGIRIGLSRWQASRRERISRMDILDLYPRMAAPVAYDGTVFVSDPGTGSGVMAIDASTGRIRWITPHGRSRPAVRDGTVYVVAFTRTGAKAGHVGVFGYDTETVKQTFSFYPSGSKARSVTASPDTLIVGTSRTGMLGVDYNGTRRWKYDPPEFQLRRYAIAVADRVAYAWGGWGPQNWLVAIDTTDGTELWRSDVATETSRLQYRSPAVANGVLYVPIGSGKNGGELVAVDATTGRVRWRFSTGKQVSWLSPAALAGETLYTLGNNHLYALEER